MKITQSRNKREGWYFGRTFAAEQFGRRFKRTHHKRIALKWFGK